MSDKNFFTLDNVSIRISNIKSYGIGGSEEIGELDQEISDMGMFSLPELGDDYIWDEFSSTPKNLAGATKFMVKNIVNKSGKGAKRLLGSAHLAYLKSKRAELARKKEPLYLFVTTYQGDNHKFYGHKNKVEFFRSKLEAELEGKK